MSVQSTRWLLLILFLLLSLLSMIPITKSDYLFSFCSNDTSFAPNSKYQSNLNVLFRSLSTNATTSNPSGFYISSAGNGTSDAVYGLFLCRGDQNATGCRNCVTTATSTDLPKTYCANRKVAVIWYDECMVRYSYKSLLGKMYQSPTVYLTNILNINGNKTQFTDLVGRTMNDVASRAATGDRIGRKFATEKANFTILETLYAMAQCTPDLTGSDCIQCLRIAMGQLSIMQGARVLQPSCNVRYETYPFYIGAYDIAVSPSPATTTGINHCSGLTGSPTYKFCSSTTFALKSKYQANLNTVLGILSSNATSNPSGFNSTAAGNGGREAVYGVFLCRGDQSVSACYECVASAITNLTKIYCHNSTKAAIWYEQCMVRYSNEPILGTLDLSSQGVITSIQKITGKDTSPSRFIDIVAKSMNDVAKKAAILNMSGKNFATLAVKVTSLLNVYVMAQCTPDPTNDYCSLCLGAALGAIKSSYMSLYSGAQILLPNCILRYGTCQFWSLPMLPATTSKTSSTGKKRKSLLRIAVIVTISTSISILLGFAIWNYMRKKNSVDSCNFQINEIKTVESLKFDLNTITAATGNFSLDNKIGEGGFGEVYKGILGDGQEVAIKRLSKNSGQGMEEFKNEVVLVANLQHKNLVKLLGFCLASNEKILVYEFMQNASLDHFLFDETKKVLLDWETRYKLIVGIARGLVYLHEDSRLTIIHRDLKPSNILLDEVMNPKISDFGLAKLFEADQIQGDTKRIVGTYGYMAPEYAMTGHFSAKSDVYSFGIIVLEIVSGKKNRVFGRPQVEEALLHRAWRLWNEGKPLDLLDMALANKYPKEEATKCIHIGLLCIQENVVERPRMPTVVAALNGQSISLPMPKAPQFFGDTSTSIDICSAKYNPLMGENEIEYRLKLNRHDCLDKYTGTQNITNLYPR